MSTIKRGYKYQIYPTEEQSNQINKFIDLSRYVYNWGVAKEEEIYEQYQQGLSQYKFYSYFDLNNLFIKERNDPDKEWLKEIPLSTARLALRNVVNAYQKFFNGNNNHPKFKSKKTCKKSFNTRSERFRIYDDQIKIEGIESRIDLGFNPNLNYTDNKYINPVITKDNLGNYFVSFSIEEEIKELETPKTEGIGIDLGVRQTFALSTGEIYNQPKEKIDRLERSIKRQERHVTRDKKSRLNEARRTNTKYEDIPKSKRAIKREQRLNKTYKKVHNIKNTYYHTITKQIADRNPEFVSMESFSVTVIEKDAKYMSKTLSEVSFYDITEKMKDKCEQHNIPFIQAPREFASTKTCSNCGSIKNMNGKHTYKCPVCGMIEDRDINAAINLKNYASQNIV